MTLEEQNLVGNPLEDLERNANYRKEAVQPMVDQLFLISIKLDTVKTLLMTQNDLLAELIRRVR